MQSEIQSDATNLDAEVSQAQAQLERLRGAAADAQAEAERWATTFEREPTPQAHTSAAVAKQKAANAQRAATIFETETLRPLVARQREAADSIERERLRAELDWAHAETEMQAMEAAVLGCRTALGEAMAELEAYLLLVRDKASRATSLGLSVPPTKIGKLVQQVSERLQGDNAAGYHGRPYVGLALLEMGSAQTLRLELQMPLQINGHVR